jgi:uncharacterized membrane protein
MSNLSTHPGLTEFELAGRAEWLNHTLEMARREGRDISAAEREVMERYARGELSGDEARHEILALFERPCAS